jgi:hypothetical protein
VTERCKNTHFDLVCGGDIRVLEEFLCFFPWPFFRYLNAAPFLLPLLASSSCLAAVLCPPCESHHIERLNRKDTLGPEVLEDLAQATVLLHQFVGCFRANTLYWFEVIATEQ